MTIGTADLGEIAVAVAIDDGYVPHFATCVASIAASRGCDAVRFFLVQGPTLSAESVRELRRFVRELGMELEAIPITADVAASVPRTRFYPPIVWYRLLIPELLRELNRALVLDADLLVLQSLWPLYSKNIGTNLLGAVGTTTARSEVGRFLALGLDPDAPYLNTGVMVMDLDAMRTERIGSRAVALGHSRSAELMFPEQDALNIIAKGQWDLLHPRWNAMSHLWFTSKRDGATYAQLDNETARRSPAIVHFEGAQTAKPWFYRSVHPLRFLYRDFRATTPWPLERLEGKSAGGALLRRLPVRSQYSVARIKRGFTKRPSG